MALIFGTDIRSSQHTYVCAFMAIVFSPEEHLLVRYLL